MKWINESNDDRTVINITMDWCQIDSVFLFVVLKDGTNTGTKYDICNHIFSSQLVSCVF